MTASPHPERRVVRVGDRDRSLLVIGPADAPAGRALVLVLHGSRQSGEAHRAFIGRALDALAADGTAVIAYLDGYRGNWNDARRESAFPARRDGIDDVAFVHAVVDLLAGSHGVDRGRVVASGFSNGGQMVLRLLHETPDLLAGAVVTGATMPAPESFLVPGSTARPVPVVLVHGTRDLIVPYAGGAFPWWSRLLFRIGGRSLSAPETAAHLARRNGITAAPAVEALPARDGSSGRTAVAATRYRQPGRPPVTLLTVHGGGHTVPGPAPRLGVGRTAEDVALVDLVRELLEDVRAAAGPTST